MLLDRSGSMTSSFGSTSRWNAVKNFLIGATSGSGFIHSFQEKARFSLTMYDEEGTNATGSGSAKACPNQCPCLLPKPFVAPFISAYDSINTQYRPMVPGSGTPTSAAIAELVAMSPTVGPTDDPTIILLATDGRPDNCDNQSGDAQDNVVAQVAAALSQKNIQTFVIAVNIADEHFQDVANAGVPGGQGTYYPVNNPDQLSEAFNKIIGGQISCTATLNGTVDLAAACEGKVSINDESALLVCQDPNGWKIVDQTHIEILGDACNRLKNAGANAKISAVFPCGTVVIGI